jgi:hypothetical protein
MRHSWRSPIVCPGCGARLAYDREQWRSASLPLALIGGVQVFLVIFGHLFLGLGAYLFVFIGVFLLFLIVASRFFWIFSKRLRLVNVDNP